MTLLSEWRTWFIPDGARAWICATEEGHSRYTSCASSPFHSADHGPRRYRRAASLWIRPDRTRRRGRRARNNLGDVCRTIKNVRTLEHPQRLMVGHGHRQIVACEHLSGLAPRSLVPARLLLKATPGGMCTSCRGSLRDRPAASPNGDGAAGVRMGSTSGNRSTLRRTSGRPGRRATRWTPGARICQSLAACR